MSDRVYKIVTARQWQEASASGRFVGSPLDVSMGFIHLSADHQVPGTLQLYFEGQDDLVLLAVDSRSLGDRLKWEVSRGEQLFPHLYDVLPCELVLSVTPVRLNKAGVHEYRLPGAETG